MNDLIQNSNIQELKILLIICGSIITLLLAVVGFFITRAITKSAVSLESMASDINEIKITVMRVDTQHSELEKRVRTLERKN